MGHRRNHELKDSDEHYTPPIVFETLNITFGTDVCAPKGGVPWIPAVNYYDAERNGLDLPWFDVVWMNPPFSSPTPWVEKFIKHSNGVALLVVSRSRWFTDLWNAADGIVPMPRNWKFVRPDGTEKSIAFQCMLFAIGTVGAKALTNFKDYRVR